MFRRSHDRGTGAVEKPKLHLTGIEWLICSIAAIGFVFDTYELLVLGLVVRPALLELLGPNASPSTFNNWVGVLFYGPAVAGGIFGLLGGYLTDRLGRRKVLTWSILLYSVSAAAAGFSESPMQLLFFRCTTFIGVSVEFVAATAWLAELFTDRQRREAILGFTQGFSSVGGLLVSGAYFVAVTYSQHFPAIQGEHIAWRYTLMSGLIPAIPLMFVRPFLPESPVWQRKKNTGELNRPQLSELFQPRFRRTAIVTMLMMAFSYAASFGALQHIPRMVPSLPEVRVLPRAAQEQIVSQYQAFTEMGGLAGRCIMASLLIFAISRKKVLRSFLIPALLISPFIYLVPAFLNVGISKWGVFALGLLTVGQFSFWGNYLPLVYPTFLRGTGESFAANIGGRMFGTAAALLTTTLTSAIPGGPLKSLAYAAGTVALLAYAAGIVGSIWLPEPEAAEVESGTEELAEKAAV